jgi:glycosyltransferase involved in cell wall biosynthesis
MSEHDACKVMIITHGLYPVPGHTVSGNGIRAWGLSMGLVNEGFEVIYATPMDTVHAHRPRHEVTLSPFSDKADLILSINSHKPKVIVVGYWAYMRLIPSDIDIPIVMDLLAPWLLEKAFQECHDMSMESIGYIKCLNRADYFICCTQRQKAYHTSWLLMSGFSGKKIPIDVIPISADPVLPERKSFGLETESPDIAQGPEPKRTFLYGGVLWPWRTAQGWISRLLDILAEKETAGRAELQIVTGKYPLHEKSSSAALQLPDGKPYDQFLKRYDLLPYDEMEKLYLKADIGIELSDKNTERELSFSFRVIDYLRCGLPVMCNDFLEVAHLIEEYDAGWVVDSSDDGAFAETVRGIIGARQDTIDLKRMNARRLVLEKFNFLETTAPLVNFCKNPLKRQQKYHLDTNLVRNEKNVHHLQNRVAELNGEIESINHRHAMLQKELREVSKAHIETCSVLVKNLERTQTELEEWKNIATGQRLIFRVKRVAGVAAAAGLFSLAMAKRLRMSLFRPGRKKNLAIVTRNDVFPVDHGAAAKIFHTARVLSFDYDEVYLITLDRERFFVFADGKMREELYPRLFRTVWFPGEVLLKSKLTASGIPEKESFLFFPMLDNNFKLRVLYVATQKTIDVYQAEFPSFMEACRWAHRLFGGLRAIVEHNVEFDRLANTYGLSDNVRARLKRYEVGLCNSVDHVIAVSHNDRERLIRAGVAESKITMIPHGVDLENFGLPKDRSGDEQSPSSPNGRRDGTSVRQRYGISEDEIVLVFHGIYNYAPNLEAAKIIETFVLPRLNLKGYHPKCLAVGKFPPAQSIHKDMIYTGVVDHVAPYIKAADIAAVPLQDGGGTRMKILEYFGAQIPVVATSKGAEGIDAIPGTTIIVEDNMDLFVDVVIDLINDPEKRLKVGKAGRRFVEAFDWKRIGKRYVNVYSGREKNRSTMK